MITDGQPSALADLNADVQSYLKSQNASLTTHNIELDYAYWNAGAARRAWSLDGRNAFLSETMVHLDDILHAILPEELLDGSPTGFSTMGHLGRSYISYFSTIAM